MENFKLFFSKNNKQILKTIFILIIIAIIFYTGVNEIKSIDFNQTKDILSSLPISYLLLFFIVGIISISLISLYDFLICNYLNLNLKKSTIFKVSFLANTINNLSGLGGLTGATIRTLLFKNSTDEKEDLINYNLLLVPSTGIGLSVLTIFSLINISYIVAIVKESIFLGISIVAFLVFIPIYFNIEKIFKYITKKDITMDRERLYLKFKLILASSIEWLFAFLLFFLISRAFGLDVGAYKLFIAFTLASIAGILSMLPGGVGSFDLLVILQLQNFNCDLESTLAVLIVYRIFYYLIPIILSVLLALIGQHKNKGGFLKFPKLKKFIKKTSPITGILLSILILISAVILLLDGLFPSFLLDRSLKINPLTNVYFRLSDHLQVAVGILLIGASYDIRHRLKKSYNFTLSLLILGAILLFIKDFSYIEASYLFLVFILVYISKDSLYRESVPRDFAKNLFHFTLLLIGIFIYTRSSIGIIRVSFKNHDLKLINFDFFKGLVISYGIPILVFIFSNRNELTIFDDSRFETFNEEKFDNFISKYNGNLTTHLAYLKDKYVFYSSNNDFFIQYEIKGKLVVALGDPIGDLKSFNAGLEEFLVFIDTYGYISAFYESSEEFLPFFHDYGYRFFKLGETSLISLDDFTMEGSKARDFRNVISRFTKDGFVFEIIKKGSLSSDDFNSLKDLSDIWLGDRKEMRFSLGFFDLEYLNHSDIAVIKNKDTGKLIAFASLMPAYDDESISIDLMRIINNPPNNTMVFLILNLLLYYKDLGYKVFNLGMAPLSNVGTTKKSHKEEKLAHFLYEYGNFFYSFQGLRNFKNKFKPNWESRYLVYEEYSQLPYVLMEVTSIIHSEKNC